MRYGPMIEAAERKFGRTSDVWDASSLTIQWWESNQGKAQGRMTKAGLRREVKAYVKAKMQPAGSWLTVLLWVMLNWPQIVKLIDWLLDQLFDSSTYWRGKK